MLESVRGRAAELFRDKPLQRPPPAFVVQECRQIEKLGMMATSAASDEASLFHPDQQGPDAADRERIFDLGLDFPDRRTAPIINDGRQSGAFAETASGPRGEAIVRSRNRSIGDARATARTRFISSIRSFKPHDGKRPVARRAIHALPPPARHARRRSLPRAQRANRHGNRMQTAQARAGEPERRSPPAGRRIAVEPHGISRIRTSLSTNRLSIDRTAAFVRRPERF